MPRKEAPKLQNMRSYECATVSKLPRLALTDVINVGA